MDLKDLNTILLFKVFVMFSVIVIIILSVILMTSLLIFGEDKVLKFLEKYEDIFDKLSEVSKKQDDKIIPYCNYFKYLFLSMSILFRRKKNRD